MYKRQLYHCGLSLGPGVGLMTLQYVFHKTTVLLYATVMLLLQHRWLAANTSGVMHYLPAAYCVVALVIVALVLLCVSPLVQRLARWAMGFLPKTEPWQTRREKWLEQLDTLAAESRLLLADKGRFNKMAGDFFKEAARREHDRPAVHHAAPAACKE